jgi:hypothetical protein
MGHKRGTSYSIPIALAALWVLILSQWASFLGSTEQAPFPILLTIGTVILAALTAIMALARSRIERGQ